MDSIKIQCKKLYIDAFNDNSSFADMLFKDYFHNCRYLTQNGIVVSMLFALDIFIGNTKGKYIFAVNTKSDMRGKGYMARLMQSVNDEFSKDYDFLCLRPANESLYNFYEKFGYETALKHMCFFEVPLDNKEKLSFKEFNCLFERYKNNNELILANEYLPLIFEGYDIYCIDDSLVFCNGKKVIHIIGNGSFEFTETNGYGMVKKFSNNNYTNTLFGLAFE